jgi:hypothetical protein
MLKIGLCSFGDVDIALFSAGGSISKKFAHIASDAGATVRKLRLAQYHRSQNLAPLSFYDPGWTARSTGGCGRRWWTTARRSGCTRGCPW